MTDRRCLFLMFPHDTKIVSHWCSPGMAGPVKRYIKKKYGFTPYLIRRSRRIFLDLGGPVYTKDPVIRLRFDGYSVMTRLGDIPFVIESMKERLTRDPKMYGDVEAYRFGSRFFNAIMTKEEMMLIIEGLKPHLTDGVTSHVATCQRLTSISNVMAPIYTPGVQGSTS